MIVIVQNGWWCGFEGRTDSITTSDVVVFNHRTASQIACWGLRDKRESVICRAGTPYTDEGPVLNQLTKGLVT